MIRKSIFHITLFLIAGLAFACSSSRHFTHTYYQGHQLYIDSMLNTYEQLYKVHPFSLEIKDKGLTRLGLELHTDSIRYIYSFRLDEPYLIDTLEKYHLDIKQFSQLVRTMQEAGCTWISKLDYYVNREPKFLIFMSIRHKALTGFLRSEKYFTLAVFDRPQLYDKKGRLLDRDDNKSFRRINDEIYKRVNDRVFFALMDKYR